MTSKLLPQRRGRTILSRRLKNRPRRLVVELLEDRWVPAIVTVTGTGDTIAVDSFVTLREAITSINNGSDLNADVTAHRTGSYGSNDKIVFNISGAGVHTIATHSALPVITNPVIIDGTTQTGYASSPLIQLDGTSAGAGVAGLWITAGGSTVKGSRQRAPVADRHGSRL